MHNTDNISRLKISDESQNERLVTSHVETTKSPDPSPPLALESVLPPGQDKPKHWGNSEFPLSFRKEDIELYNSARGFAVEYGVTRDPNWVYDDLPHELSIDDFLHTQVKILEAIATCPAAKERPKDAEICKLRL